MQCQFHHPPPHPVVVYAIRRKIFAGPEKDWENHPNTNNSKKKWLYAMLVFLVKSNRSGMNVALAERGNPFHTPCIDTSHLPIPLETKLGRVRIAENSRTGES
jgi:hypothetical protein